MTIYDEDHGPIDPDERRAWKAAMYHAHYGAGPETIASYVRTEAERQDLARRHRRYIWILRGTMLCTLGTLYVLITHPSWRTVSCFIVACSMGLLVLMNPPRSQ